MRSDEWRDFWEYLDLRCVTFQDIGLDSADSDTVVWHQCQKHHVLLLTNNRNDDGPQSLEATIRANNTPQSLPVFTIGDADNLLASGDYVDRVIDRLIRYLLQMDNLRGTGRLYLP
jgi:hypothetical protein